MDGIFGVYTESAVKMFQSWASLDQDGIVGPLTWEKLDLADKSDPTLQEGSKGVAVRGLQRMLIGRGFEPGEIDGRFGPKTEARRPGSSRATTGSTSTGSSARRRGTPCARSTRTDASGGLRRMGRESAHWMLELSAEEGAAVEAVFEELGLERAHEDPARRGLRRARPVSLLDRPARPPQPDRRASRCGSP